MRKFSIIVSLFLVALLSVVLLSACGENSADGNDTGDTTAAGSNETTAAAETAFDPTAITGKDYGTANPTLAAYLKFEGENATLKLYSEHKETIITGAYTIDESTLKIGDSEFAYDTIGYALNLETPDIRYRLVEITSDEERAWYLGAYDFITNDWTSDDATVTFDGENLQLNIPSVSIEFNAKWILETPVKVSLVENVENIPVETDENGNEIVNSTNFVYNIKRPKASSCANYVTTPPRNAFDANIYTEWESSPDDAGNPVTLTMDMGEVKTIGSVRIIFNNAPDSYKIFTSTDNENWTEVISVEAGGGGYVKHGFFPVDAQYVKFEGISSSTDNGMSFYEFEVYEKIFPVEKTFDLNYTDAGTELTYDGVVYNLTKVAA